LALRSLEWGRLRGSVRRR